VKRKWLRRLLWLGGGLVMMGLLLWGVMLALMFCWVAKEPVLADTQAIVTQVPETRGDRVYLGQNWFGKREGLPVLYLTGTPFEMGYANGVLTQKQIHRQEDSVVALLNHVAPYRWLHFTLEFFVTYKNRHMTEYITPDLQLEMLGIARGCPDGHPEMGPYYNRILNYHGAQDISYMLMNSPLIRRGCTAFGAWGAATTKNHLLCGRNFDWEADPVFDEDRLLIFCEPKNGIAFVSLAWAGMAGCVSGMNREGVSITVNGAPSDLPSDAAVPTCLVAREVLEHAHNLAEATDIIRQRKVFVSAMFLVGSRADGKFIVIEKTPRAMAVRTPGQTDDSLVCANHYLTPEFKDTAINETYQRADTSLSRFDRMTELLQTTNALDAADCVALLRDRRLPGGQLAGDGHRGSLNPLIATHAVVMDLTTGIFWAATPPHQLGKFVAFDVNAPEKLLPEQAVPADPMLTDGEYAHYLAGKTNLSDCYLALKKGDLDAAKAFALQAETNNPGYYQNAWLLTEVLFRQGKHAEAAAACQRALDGKPALGGERRKVEELLKQCTAPK
jgi:tetratricopeptide (TPR) repeat protein/predicted small integral membrane protein